MTPTIDSMSDLPQDVQERESATFDFGKVKAILKDGYFRGPAVNEDDYRGGMRSQSLRGNPASHRKSILRKAVETDLLEETSLGYATTPNGFDLLDQMLVCESCGMDEEAFVAGIKTGRVSGYAAIFSSCTNCENPLSASNTSRYERGDDSLEEAVEVMESHDVVCYLNGKTVDQVKKDLGI